MMESQWLTHWLFWQQTTFRIRLWKLYFTVGEEVGLIGATALDASDLTGKNPDEYGF